jgi:uncharacterized protein YjiS (DUF1127 family)
MDGCFGPARSVRTVVSAAGETFLRERAHLFVSTREEMVMPTFDLFLPRSYSVWRPKAQPTPIHPVAAAWVLIASWIARTRQRNALAGLDDAMLRDIGITRVEAARECDKPFWR